MIYSSMDFGPGFGVRFNSSKPSIANLTHEMWATNGFTLSTRSDHLVPDLP